MEDFFSSPIRSLSFFASIAVTIAYGIAVSILLRRIADRKKTYKDRFFKSLTEGLKSQTLNDLNDVKNLYLGIRGSAVDSTSSASHLSSWLREYLVKLHEDGVKEDSEDLNSRKDFITECLNQNEQQSPYAALPDLERSLISDIEGFLASDDKKAIRRKLGEVTSAILDREDMLLKIRNTNRWSVPLAVIGLILTITFSSISIIK